MKKNEYAESFKVCIIGRYSVGKTALINRYITDLFTGDYKPTIATCFTEVCVPLRGKNISIKLWDTAGQEKFQSLTPLLLQDCDCVILVIDITIIDSFNYVDNWINNEWQSMNPLPILIICLNKCDLSPCFDLENVAELASSYNIPVVQTSALSGANVSKLFQKAAEMLSESTHYHSYVCAPLDKDAQKSCC